MERVPQKTKRFRGFRKAALFCCLFAAVFWVCQEVLVLRFEQDTCMEKRYELYRQEPPGSIDMLIIGSSQLFWGVAPTVMWEEAGFTSVNFSSRRQTALIAYYQLRTLLEMNTAPKFALFDMNDLTRDSSADVDFYEPAYYRFLRSQPSLPLRLEFIRDTVNSSQKQDFGKYLFPLLRYHSRWDELKAVDFWDGRDYDALYEDYRKGVMPRAIVQDQSALEAEFEREESSYVLNPDVAYDKGSLLYWEKTVDLCREQGIQPIVMIPRRYDREDSITEAALVEGFCEERGIPCINYNDDALYQETDLDAATDYLDYAHVNVQGSFKLSRALARQMGRLVDLPDHRGDDGYRAWDAWSREYEEVYGE